MAEINIDLLVRVLLTSIFHPFITSLIPLCQRALARPWTDPSIIISIVWASLVSVAWLLAKLNRRLAFGLPRPMRFTARPRTRISGDDGDDDNDEEDDDCDDEEVVVITGGARGLGLLMAEVYAMRGAKVAVVDVVDMTDSVFAARERINWYRCDVGDRSQVEDVNRRITEDLGTPTILINNAAVAHGKSLLQLTADEVERTIRTNLLSHFHTIQVFLPSMLRRKAGGTIVTISSSLAYIGCKKLADYTASKAGLLALHASLKAELPRHSNVRTVLVTPGQMSTPLFAGVKTPSTFWGPVLEPVDVAKEIIATVDAGVNAELAMPLYARWIQLLAVMPFGLQRIFRALAGPDEAMDSFVGRSVQKEKQKGGGLASTREDCRVVM